MHKQLVEESSRGNVWPHHKSQHLKFASNIWINQSHCANESFGQIQVQIELFGHNDQKWREKGAAFDENNTLPEWRQKYSALKIFYKPWNWERLQQDSHPKQTSRSSMNHFKKHKLKFLKQPSHSPDLNITENLCVDAANSYSYSYS